MTTTNNTRTTRRRVVEIDTTGAYNGSYYRGRDGRFEGAYVTGGGRAWAGRKQAERRIERERNAEFYEARDRAIVLRRELLHLRHHDVVERDDLFLLQAAIDFYDTLANDLDKIRHWIHQVEVLLGPFRAKVAEHERRREAEQAAYRERIAAQDRLNQLRWEAQRAADQEEHERRVREAHEAWLADAPLRQIDADAVVEAEWSDRLQMRRRFKRDKLLRTLITWWRQEHGDTRAKALHKGYTHVDHRRKWRREVRAFRRYYHPHVEAWR